MTQAARSASPRLRSARVGLRHAAGNVGTVKLSRIHPFCGRVPLSLRGGPHSLSIQLPFPSIEIRIPWALWLCPPGMAHPFVWSILISPTGRGRTGSPARGKSGRSPWPASRRCRQGSGSEAGTILSETNGHYYRHLAMIFPSRKPIGKQADHTDGASGGCHQGRPGRNPAPRTSARSNGTTSFSTASTSSIVPGCAKERVLMLYFNTNVGATLSSPAFVALGVSLPAPVAPRSSAASRRRVAGSDDLPPAGASSTWHASPAGLRFSPAAAGDS